MKKDWMLLINPFKKVAGGTALVWGVCGLIVSMFLCYHSGYHYHGLLHFGPAPDDSFWHFAAEVLSVCLLPATLFYIGGILLSKSRIRLIDVLGTTAFAQLPLIFMNLFYSLPAAQRILRIDLGGSIEDMLANPTFMRDSLIIAFSIIFIVWALVWMYHALRVSCNLKGVRLGVWYAVSIVCGDILCWCIINTMY